MLQAKVNYQEAVQVQGNALLFDLWHVSIPLPLLERLDSNPPSLLFERLSLAALFSSFACLSN